MPLVDARIRCSAGVGTSGRAEHGTHHHTVKRPVLATSRPIPFPRPRRDPFVSGRLGKDAGSGLAPPLLQTQLEPQELVWTKFVAETVLPTAQGKFKLRGYRHTVDGGVTFTEPCVIYSGSLDGQTDLLVRVHDACFTSEVLGSLKCDCREQLALALDYIRDNPPGAVIYLQQEGRGIGLANKIAAYALQERGLDTVDANRALGLPDDAREYSAVRHILADVGVQSVRVMTNNPRKLAQLTALGIAVTGRVPCVVPAQAHSRGYLSAKRLRMDHLFDATHVQAETKSESDSGPNPGKDVNSAVSTVAGFDDGEGASDAEEGAFCYWNHEGEPGNAGVPPVPEPDAPYADVAAATPTFGVAGAGSSVSTGAVSIDPQ